MRARRGAGAASPRGALLGAGLALLAARCASPLSLEDRPCPCATGFSCCEATQLCLRPGATCGAADAGAEGDASSGCGAARAACGPGCCVAVKSVAAGEGHTWVVTRAGAVLCWGNGEDGQLGDGKAASSFAPVAVTGLGAGVTSVTGGSHVTCALTEAQGALCWGSNQLGDLGTGKSTSISPVPVQPALDGPVRSISSGGGHTCAVAGGGVSCWGADGVAQLGTGAPSPDGFERLPQRVASLGILAERVFAGGSASCATDFKGRLSCWGALFDGSAPYATPTSIFGLEAVDAIAISRSNHACILQSSRVKCWGSNQQGAVGDGAPAASVPSPVEVPGLSGPMRSVGVGFGYSCALSEAGAVACWGDNTAGKLGDGQAASSRRPVQPEGLSSGVAALSVGHDHACVVMETGAVKCWGSNTYGQLSIPEVTASRTPVDVTSLR